MSRVTLWGLLIAIALVSVDARAQSQRPFPPSVWAVTDWYVNASTGSDDSTCTTSGAPCQHFSEIIARLGTRAPQAAQAVTYHIQTDLPNTDPTDLAPILNSTGGTGFVTLQGGSVSVGAGTIAGVVARNRVTGQALAIDLGANISTFMGMNICDTTHPSCAIVDSVSSGSIAFISQPIAPDNTTEVTSWANGDSYIVTRPIKVFASSWVDMVLDNVWVQQVPYAGVTSCTECSFIGSWVDPSASMSFLDSGIINSKATAATLSGSSWNAGIGTSLTLGDESSVGLDVVLHGSTIATGLTFFDEEYMASGSQFTAETGTAFADANAGIGSAFYGPSYVVGVTFGYVDYCGTGAPGSCSALTSFLGGATLNLFGNTNAMACDRTVDPMQCRPNRALTPSNLDTSIASGGFSGIALNTPQGSGFVQFDLVGQVLVPTNYVAPTINGGTGLDLDAGGCPDGSFIGNTPLRCAVPPPGASVLAGAAISVAGGPAYTVSNTDPGANVSVLAGANISSVTHVGEAWTVNAATQGTANCPINLASCVTGSLALSSLASCSNGQVVETVGGVQSCANLPAGLTNNVSSGLTGNTSFPAHSSLLGEGTSPISSVGPCASGLVAVGAGSSADPACGQVPVSTVAPCLNGQIIQTNSGVQTCVNTSVLLPSNTVPNGFTGVTSFTANATLIGAGTSAIATAGPGTAGAVYQSNGSGSPPTFGPVAINNPSSVNGTLSSSNGGFGTGSHTFGSVPEFTGSAFSDVFGTVAGQLLTWNGSQWLPAANAALSSPFDVYTSSYNNTCATVGTTATSNVFTSRAGHLDIAVDVPTVGLGSGSVPPGTVTFAVFVGSTNEASWQISIATLSTNSAGGSWHGWIAVPSTTIQVQVQCFGNFPSGTSGANIYQTIKSYGF